MDLIEVFAEPKFRRIKRVKKVTIAKKDYDVIQSWLMLLLAAEIEISLQKLIEKGEAEIELPKSNLSWLIVLVKNDMACRGEIDVEIDEDRNQLVKFRKRK